MNKSIRLEAPSKSGGKFYVVEIKPAGADGFTVDFQHGAIGGNTKSGTKTPTPVGIEAAEAIYQALVMEKMNGSSHYVAAGQSTAEFERPALAATNAEVTKCFPPRLLNDIHPGLIVSLTEDPNWWIQIKHDGDRVQLHVKGGRVTLFSGRSTKLRGCPKPIAEAVKTEYGDGSCVLDGELVGDVLWVFDAFEVNGKDLTCQPYHERYHWLLRLEAVMESPSIRIVRAAETHNAKVALIKKAKEEHAEGVCFINRNARYEPGRPNAGGNNLRWKFRASASLIVAEHHPSKNSLDVMFADGARIGSVTMIGKTRPPVGAVIEVEYLYCQSALVQAVFKGIRTDVLPEACTRGQLQFKDGVDPLA
jgi:bifunctional non-homologous end joining protein LigD